MITRLAISLFLLSVTSLSVADARELVIRGKHSSEVQPKRWSERRVSDRNLLGLEYDGKYRLPSQALSADNPRVIRILALKVNFRKEVPDDPLTTGDGNFDPRSKEQFLVEEGHLIDPAPHNSEYFLAHLQALDAYYQVVSNGRLRLEYEIYPRQSDSAYQLDSAMAYYGLQPPQYGLAEFVYDAFQQADRDPQLEFWDESLGQSRYEAYIVFHAGSDQQNNSPIFGQPTPGDLWTGFIKFGQPFPVAGGRVWIEDATIMPETVSQDGRVNAMNAVMAHEFAHQLGGVDLYDTRTFNTAVGDFSLMDNNGFGVNVDLGEDTPVLVQGVMPIFPDAWHRAYWGFVDVIEITSGINVTVAAAGLQSSEKEVVLVPINADEYFLIENRRTDLDGDGVTWLSGDPETDVILWPRSPSNPANNREYDFLIPGSGMLIWHIDELVARLDYDGDGINNFDDNQLQWFNFPQDTRRWDNRRQFVAVKEADGIIHFGREYFAGFGRQADMFEINNNNNFGPFTNPPSSANNGAYTGITISNISAALPVMTCNISVRGRQAGWPNYVGQGALPMKVYDLNNNGSEEIITAVNNYILAYQLDGRSLFQPISGNEVIVERPTKYGDGKVIDTLAVFGHVGRDKQFILSLAIGDLDGDGFAEIVGVTNRMTVAAFNSRTFTYTGEAVRRFETFIDEPPAIAPIILDYRSDVPGKEILIYTMTGRKIVLNQAGQIIANEPAVWPYRVLTTADKQFELVSPAGGLRNGDPIATTIRGAAAADFDGDGSYETVEVYRDGILRINYAEKPIEVYVGGPIFSEISLGDINNDGRLDILFCGDNLIYAYNYNGVAVENFPIEVNRAYPVGSVRTSPLLVDLDRDGEPEIFVGTKEGELAGFDRRGRRLESFPKATGGNVDQPIILARSATSAAVFALSREGEINSYSVLVPGQTEWNTLYGSAQNYGSYLRTLSDPTLPTEAIGYVYNYPNPAREYTTIRFSVRQSGSVRLRFYNTAGELVLEEKVSGQAGIDNEFGLDCSGLASGVYFCQLETDAGDRKTCSIAILK